MPTMIRLLRPQSLPEAWALLDAQAEEIARLHAQVAALTAQVQALTAQVETLSARLNQNSSNSSKPPSSDPPHAPKRPSKQPTGRKRGAQPGHEGHTRHLVASDEVDEVVDHHPTVCPTCQMPLPPDLPDAMPPERRQVWELPKVKPLITEHRRHTVVCPHCQTPVKASDAAMPQAGFGVRATAVASVLHGRFRLSLRETAAVLEVVGGLPVSVGATAGMCQETSEALAEPMAALVEQVRADPVVNVDETSWRQAGKRPWIWTMVGKQATVFRVLKRRNALALQEVLGPSSQGTVVSDRFRAYQSVPIERRAICWAHLKRDFQGFAEWGGQIGAWGKQLLAIEEAVFREWHRFRTGELGRPGLRRALVPIQDQLRTLLDEGRQRRATAGFCQDLLTLWPALWTFAEREGVEPTNNAAEQALRPVVLWRKGCFGAVSDWGNQFVERILSVGATCRQQGVDLLETVVNALTAWRAAHPMAHPA